MTDREFLEEIKKEYLKLIDLRNDVVEMNGRLKEAAQEFNKHAIRTEAQLQSDVRSFTTLLAFSAVWYCLVIIQTWEKWFDNKLSVAILVGITFIVFLLVVAKMIKIYIKKGPRN